MVFSMAHTDKTNTGERTKEGSISKPTGSRKRETLGLAWDFKALKHTHSDTLSSTMSHIPVGQHLLILLR